MRGQVHRLVEKPLARAPFTRRRTSRCRWRALSLFGLPGTGLASSRRLPPHRQALLQRPTLCRVQLSVRAIRPMLHPFSSSFTASSLRRCNSWALPCGLMEAVIGIRDQGTLLLQGSIAQLHEASPTHNIGRFRLSATTAQPPYPLEASGLSIEDLETHWADLASSDTDWSAQAAEAIFQSGHALPFLRQKLKPDEGSNADPVRIARLLRDLDHEEFRVRYRASCELGQLGIAAFPFLVKQLEDRPSLEAEQRVEQLIAQIKDSPEFLIRQRGVNLLVRIGSPESRSVLQSLAEGPPDAVLTRAAKAALTKTRQPEPPLRTAPASSGTRRG